MDIIYGVTTVAAPDVCFPCQKYSSNGYADWYEYMPVMSQTVIGDIPQITPIPEPSAVMLMLAGLVLLRFFKKA